MQTVLRVRKKIEKFSSYDPKPLFDHFRNIAIAAALALGANALHILSSDIHHVILSKFALWSSYIAFAIATMLLFLNTLHAYNSINSCFTRVSNSSISKKLAMTSMVLYLFLLVALTVMYSFDSLSKNADRQEHQKTTSERIHLNIDKVAQTAKQLSDKNIELENENARLKNEINTLNEKITKLKQLASQTTHNHIEDQGYMSSGEIND